MAPDAPDAKILFVDHVEEGKKGRLAPVAKDLTTVECVDCCGSNVDDKPGMSQRFFFLYSVFLISINHCA
jgi:hypothetical protein